MAKKSDDPTTAKERAQIFRAATLTAAEELRATGAAPLEVAMGILSAAVDLLVEAAGRESARRLLHEYGDGLLPN